MITYELAKQLKDAGFPQTGERPWYCGGHNWYDDSDDDKGRFEECPEKGIQKPEDRYCESAEMTAEFAIEVPTLSELIEACKCDFLLKKFNKVYHIEILEMSEWKNLIIGSEGTFAWHSPEEAVANLWLELQK